MKIRIAMCTADIQYGRKISQYFQVHYYDKFVWNIFTETTYLLEYLKDNEVDIVLLGNELKEEVDLSVLSGVGDRICAYLVEDSEESEKGHQLEKYSRGDKIYRELLELYSLKSNIHFQNTATVNNKTEIYAFVAPAGGVGTSTIASAVAQSSAALENVLYINLETISSSGLVYEESGKKGFDELIFAIKSRRSALELKLASAVSRDNSGVYFFENSQNPMDLMELNPSDIKELFSSIQQIKEYDKVIVDVGNALGEKEIAAMTYANRIVCILDDTENAEKKCERYISTLQIVEQKNKVDICSKMILFYNKVMKHSQLPEQKFQIRIGGSFPKIENGTYDGIINKIAALEIIRGVK